MAPPVRNTWIDPRSSGWVQFAPARSATSVAAADVRHDDVRDDDIVDAGVRRMLRRADERDARHEHVEGTTASSSVVVRVGPWNAVFIGAPVQAIVLREERDALRAELARVRGERAPEVS